VRADEIVKVKPPEIREKRMSSGKPGKLSFKGDKPKKSSSKPKAEKPEKRKLDQLDQTESDDGKN